MTSPVLTAESLSRTTLAQADAVTTLGIGGVMAWTTTVANGSFGLGSDEAVGAVTERWSLLQSDLARLGVHRLAAAHQIHGTAVSVHQGGWTGWLRQRDVDGHVTTVPGTALAVTIADCTPVFIAHESGIALLHAGWRGTAAGILKVGLEAMAQLGMNPVDCSMHLGPSICAPCYEVGPEVLRAVTGLPASEKGHLDVRAVLAEQAYASGVRSIDVSKWCTRCSGGRFYSHRAGDAGRQLGVLALMKV
ncbi:MAG: polyphenol oxidase family protein [Phycisphaerae bacterium]|nr:polyphenol oxidase family protein [Gemmatimonadaceae bacterium]